MEHRRRNLSSGKNPRPDAERGSAGSGTGREDSSGAMKMSLRERKGESKRFWRFSSEMVAGQVRGAGRDARGAKRVSFPAIFF